MRPSHNAFHHPYDPYDIQLDFMQKLYQCIEDRHVGIFESPTGTGKSLSLICASLTWLRDNEKRRLYGDQEGDEFLDWLEQAEKDAQIKRIMEERRETEQKLKAIRVKHSKSQNHPYHVKRVKIDDQLNEQDLVIDDYESDNEKHSHDSGCAQSLSSSTVALLDRLKPTKSTNEGQEEGRIKVIFSSRTHSQLTQFVHELAKVNIPSGESEKPEEEVVKHLSLGSRKNLCINTKVNRLTSTTAINERCIEFQKPGSSQSQKCEFLPSKASNEDVLRLENFKDNIMSRIQDIEDVASLGRKMRLCPYYASRSVIAPVEVLTLPYPLLLQKSARDALGIEIKDNVVIIDEAHNLMSAVADVMSVRMPLSHLELAQSQLLGYCQKFKNKLKGKNRVYIAQIIRLLKSCISRVELAKNSKTRELILLAGELMDGSGIDQIQPHKLVKYIQESKLVYKVEAYSELFHQQHSPQVTTASHAQTLRMPKGVLAEFQNLLIAMMNPGSEGRFFISLTEVEPTLKYTLLDPQAHFEYVVQEARAVVLAGGTMSPMADWYEQLFPYMAPERLKTYSFGHIVAKSNVLVQPLSQGPNGIEFDFTFKNRLSEKMVKELATVLERLCMTAPDGIVVFFPSYDYLAFATSVWKRSSANNSIYQRIAAVKAVFQESKDVVIDDLLRDYASAVESGKGALMLAVVGGKLSEGINFSDKLGRVVVCVGLPYPNIKSAEWKAKIEYIERVKYEKLKREGMSEHEYKAKAEAAGREYADNTTMRAVNQSIGRAIRHKNDYAAIYLIDKRYATSRIQAKLPAWLAESICKDSSSWQEKERACINFFAGKRR